MKLDYLTKDSRFADNSSRVTHRADLISVLQKRFVAYSKSSLSTALAFHPKLARQTTFPTDFGTMLQGRYHIEEKTTE